MTNADKGFLYQEPKTDSENSTQDYLLILLLSINRVARYWKNNEKYLRQITGCSMDHKHIFQLNRISYIKVIDSHKVTTQI